MGCEDWKEHELFVRNTVGRTAQTGKFRTEKAEDGCSILRSPVPHAVVQRARDDKVLVKYLHPVDGKLNLFNRGHCPHFHRCHLHALDPCTVIDCRTQLRQVCAAGRSTGLDQRGPQKLNCVCTPRLRDRKHT